MRSAERFRSPIQRMCEDDARNGFHRARFPFIPSRAMHCRSRAPFSAAFIISMNWSVHNAFIPGFRPKLSAFRPRILRISPDRSTAVLPSATAQTWAEAPQMLRARWISLSIALEPSVFLPAQVITSRSSRNDPRVPSISYDFSVRV